MANLITDARSRQPAGHGVWHAGVLLVYLCLGLIAFAPILTAGFVADDWDFLLIVSRAPGAMIAFAPLVGRFIRPLVVLTYYVNYKLFGLWTLPYHLTLVLLHILNAWLVCRLGERIAGGSRVIGFGAGLLFLLFAGHSEAVSWVAGAADPWLLLVFLSGLLLVARGLDAGGPRWPLLAGTAVLAAGPLAKESGVIAPALVVAYGLAAIIDGGDRRRIVVRTMAVACALAAIGAIYLLLRRHQFGSVFGAYGELGTSRGVFLQQARAFVLRSFLPPSTHLAAIWLRGYDLAMLAGGLVLLAAVATTHRTARGGLLFTVAALLMTLAPVLPLSISVIHTVSERYVYVPTAFASILTVWMASLVFARYRLVAAVAVLLFAALHWRGLARANRTWVESGELFRTFMTELAATIRAQAPTARVFMLNVPDNVRGAFVVRSAFLPGLRLLAPDIARPEDRATLVASQDMAAAGDVTFVERQDTRRFFVRLSAGAFAQTAASGTPDYDFQSWTPQQYVLAFKPATRPAVVTYTSGGHLRIAASIDGMPFGFVDIPADGSPCTGDAVRFSGWALDDRDGLDVTLSRDGPGSEAGGATIPLGTAAWHRGSRPDVAAAFGGFPSSDRAEWNYWLPCREVRGARRPTRVHVVATDSAGQRVELGSRTITILP